MIAPMTRYNFILLKGEEAGLLENLQEMGLMDITRSAKVVDAASGEMLAEIERLSELIRRLNAFAAPEGTALPASAQENAAEEETNASILADKAEQTLDEYARVCEALVTLTKETAALRVWGDYSPERLRTLDEAGMPVHFHRLSSRLFQSAWAAEYALTLVDDSDKSNIYFVVAGPDDLPGEIPAPARPVAAAESEVSEMSACKSSLESRLLALLQHLPELEALRSDALARLDLYLAGAAANPAADDYVLTFEGFAPRDKEAEIVARLEEKGYLYLKENAVAEENPPIALKNNAFVRMFEMLTDMYGRPAYDGFDPTPFISVFFMLFFAFCMGDCGYGIILMLAGLMMKKADAFKSLSPLVVTLGCATTVIGFLFHTFFSMDIATWSIFQPIQKIFLPSKIMGYDGTMILSLLVGIFHVCLAMVVKTVMATRNKGLQNALGTWGWTLLIVGGVIVAGIAFAGVISAPVTRWVVIVLGVISALGIFLLNDLHRNPLRNIGSGLWETYNTVTGLLGDVLSYLRLYALGLAGSMLGLAFNRIGLMVLGDGSSVLMWVPFVLIVVVGHVLNIAMCVLGAFVHPLRLNFLEFFKNSGYQALGRKYNPLTKTINN